MKIDPTETIDGMPLIRARDFLRERWRHFESAFDESDVTEFCGLPGPAARQWLQAAIARAPRDEAAMQHSLSGENEISI
jgi:hypothetical protein